MAVLMRGSGSGDGVHGGVLDSGVRGARPGGFRGALGEPAGDQAGERAQERRAGLPVDPATHELWTVAGRVPGAGRAVPDALLRAPARPTHTRPQPRGAAHAKGAGADECAVGQCAERHHGQDRPIDRARHRRGRAGRGGAGEVPGRSLQGERDHHRGQSAGQLARRTPVRPATGVGPPRHAARPDRSVRDAHRRRTRPTGSSTGRRTSRPWRGAPANAFCGSGYTGCWGPI